MILLISLALKIDRLHRKNRDLFLPPKDCFKKVVFIGILKYNYDKA